MSLTATTLSAAVAVNDNQITVASATDVGIGRLLQVDAEWMQVTKAYVAGSTTVPVLRGQCGSETEAHPVTANVIHGDPSDFDEAAAQTGVADARQVATVRRSYSADGAITLPNRGEDVVAILNGTSVIAATIAAPGKDIDGARLTILANGAAAHTLTFTGGLSLAGTSYDVITMNGTKPMGITVYACNGAWICPIAPAMGGTVTNLIGTLS